MSIVASCESGAILAKNVVVYEQFLLFCLDAGYRSQRDLCMCIL